MSNNYSNLVRFDQNGLELVINETTGECFASQSATARMCETSESNIRYMCTSRKWDRMPLEIPTESGFRSSQVLNEDQIGECLAKYNPSLLVQCLKVGLRVYLHRLAGFDIRVEAPQPIKSTAQMFAMASQVMMEHEAQLQAIQAKLERIELNQSAAKEKLLALPEPSAATPALATRRAILKAVSQYCAANDVDQRMAWNLLYEELRLRCGVAIKLRKKITKQESLLDVAIRLGYGDQLYAIAYDMLGLKNFAAQ